MTTIAIPAILDWRSANGFEGAVASARTAAKVVFEFSQLTFAEPFGTLLVAAILRKFARQRPPGTVFVQGLSMINPAHGYLSHIGFFQYVGISVGNMPGSAKGSESYVPIVKIHREEIVRAHCVRERPIGFAVSREAARLAHVLTSKNDMTVNRPLAYCIREIIRNAFEHGATEECFVSAQRWGTGEFELAIADEGRGVRQSLGERMNTQNDAEALRLAIQPGVSRSVPSCDGDEWTNSGFGLWVLSELGRRCGTFVICSGDFALSVVDGVDSCTPFRFSGTAIRLRLKKPKGCSFEKIVDEIIADGERASALSSLPRRASKSSRMY